MLRLSEHARHAAEDESIPRPAILRIVREGVPRSKDVTTHSNRQIGINFEGKRHRRTWLRAKVGWRDNYVVITVHTL